MRLKQRKEEGIEAGFSLLEALISVSFLSVVAVTLLQSLAFCLEVSQRARDLWSDSLAAWNQVQELRSEHADRGDPVLVFPNARPMFFREVAVGQADDQNWGILNASK
jgi:Tfp pilus assembly protein PilV